ncbi:MAG: FlgD immunoglobulin-like domain containing protein, partial [Candidatus Syntrophosphaera sp.]
IDAYLTLKYINDPFFRFETQSGEEAILEDVSMNVSQDGYSYTFAFDPAEDLRCFFFQFLPVDGVVLEDYDLIGLSGEPLAAYNPDTNKLAWIYDLDVLDAVDVTLQTSLDSVELFYGLNGATGSVDLTPNSPLDDPQIPGASLSLAQNYPNPFNPKTTIAFYLPQVAHVELLVYNTRGQLIRKLVDGVLNKGSARILWDGLDESGEPVSSGLYHYRLICGEEELTRRMILLK